MPDEDKSPRRRLIYLIRPKIKIIFEFVPTVETLSEIRLIYFSNLPRAG